jgi:hypothetical protein
MPMNEIQRQRSEHLDDTSGPKRDDASDKKAPADKPQSTSAATTSDGKQSK